MHHSHVRRAARARGSALTMHSGGQEGGGYTNLHNGNGISKPRTGKNDKVSISCSLILPPHRARQQPSSNLA